MNLFIHFFLAHILVSLILVTGFCLFSSSSYLGGVWGMALVAMLGSFLFSALIPSWFSLSQYGFLYWLIYYSVPAIGAILGLLLLRLFSQSHNDL